MNKPKPWSGKPLKGDWYVTIKVDGVRALWQEPTVIDGTQGWYSRAGKPLYNIPPWEPGMPKDAECCVGSFKDTIRSVRTKAPKKLAGLVQIKREHLYGLDPIDPRLDTGITLHDPKPEELYKLMNTIIAQGWEGLVIRQGDKWLKVKPEETHDVQVLDMVEGVGKHAGRMGALVTSMGEVGTGFTDEERVDWWARRQQFRDGKPPHIRKGQYTIEVSCMHLTPDGKFRHPRFVRERPDKVGK